MTYYEQMLKEVALMKERLEEFGSEEELVVASKGAIRRLLLDAQENLKALFAENINNAIQEILTDDDR